MIFGRYRRLLRAYEVLKERYDKQDIFLERVTKSNKGMYTDLQNQVNANTKLRARPTNYGKRVIALEQAIITRNNIIKVQRVELDELRQLVKQLQDPDSDTCTKIKCCDENEAKDLAIYLSMRMQDIFIAYDCKVCPTNKRTKKSYWHATHQDPKRRGKYYG